MAETPAELRAMSDEQLEERITAAARVTSGSLNYYVAEHARRDAERVRRDQDRQARTLTRLTWVATVAAVLSLLAAVIQVIAAVIALR
jgi:hypothetical protein